MTDLSTKNSRKHSPITFFFGESSLDDPLDLEPKLTTSKNKKQKVVLELYLQTTKTPISYVGSPYIQYLFTLLMCKCKKGISGLALVKFCVSVISLFSYHVDIKQVVCFCS